MGSDLKSAVIDGVQYQYSCMGATESYRMLLRIGKMVGPSAGHLIDQITKTIAGKVQLEDVDIKGDVFAKAFSELFDRATEAEVDFVIDKLKEKTLVNKQPLKGVFDFHFQGKMLSLMKWVKWALSAEYGDFSVALSSAIGGAGITKLEEVATKESA